MICQLCGHNQATVCLNIDLNGQKIQQFICEQCAEERQLKDNPSPQTVFALVNEIKARQEQNKEKQNTENDSVCSECGIKFSDFKKTGLLGCPGCYKSFSSLLATELEKITKPIEKEPAPQAPAPDTKLLKLQLLLKRAIESEDYEAAARLRDEIAVFRTNSEVKANE